MNVRHAVIACFGVTLFGQLGGVACSGKLDATRGASSTDDAGDTRTGVARTHGPFAVPKAAISAAWNVVARTVGPVHKTSVRLTPPR
jgi:hypothetical protein